MNSSLISNGNRFKIILLCACNFIYLRKDKISLFTIENNDTETGSSFGDEFNEDFWMTFKFIY